MSTTEHLLDPWRIEHNRTADGDAMVCVVDSAGETAWQGYATPKNIARARRIVACVNYCADVPDETLTKGHAQFVRADRDRLLATLDDLKYRGTQAGWWDSEAPAMANAEQAMAGR